MRLQPHFEILTGLLDLVLQLEQLLEGVVKEDYLSRCLMLQALTDLFETLRLVFQQLDDECSDVRNRPHVLSLVFHLIIKWVLDQLEVGQQLDLHRLVRVRIVTRLRYACVTGLGPDDVIWDLVLQSLHLRLYRAFHRLLRVQVLPAELKCGRAGAAHVTTLRNEHFVFFDAWLHILVEVAREELLERFVLDVHDLLLALNTTILAILHKVQRFF